MQVENSLTYLPIYLMLQALIMFDTDVDIFNHKSFSLKLCNCISFVKWYVQFNCFMTEHLYMSILCNLCYCLCYKLPSFKSKKYLQETQSRVFSWWNKNKHFKLWLVRVQPTYSKPKSRSCRWSGIITAIAIERNIFETTWLFKRRPEDYDRRPSKRFR